MQRNPLLEKLKESCSRVDSSLDNSLIEWKNLSIEEKPLHEGENASIHLGSTNTAENKIKVIIKKSYPKYNHVIYDEAVKMKMVKSKYTVDLMGISINGDSLAIVMKRYKTNLTDLLTKFQPDLESNCLEEKKSIESKSIEELPTISYKKKLEWGKTISYGLQHIHDCKLVHCDIKGRNIFVDKEGNVKIGDFGLTQPISYLTKPGEDPRGTVQYMAPELCEMSEDTETSSPHTMASDVYSLGVVFWQLMTHLSPFERLRAYQIAATKILKNHESIPENCPEFFKRLISACWQNDPSKRPTAQWIGEQFELELKKLTEHLPSVSSTGLFSHSKRTLSPTEINPHPIQQEETPMVTSQKNVPC
jgi:serine/threonine protein kinase